MPTYIGCKMIKAKQMTLGEYRGYRGWDMGKDESTGTEGYLVEYPDSNSNHENHEGYISWSPKEVFESAYLQLEDPTRITLNIVDDFIKPGADSARKGNHTVLFTECKNGFTQVTDSACVDPNNYDSDIGFNLAMGKAKNTVWQGLGFVLAWAKNGLKK